MGFGPPARRGIDGMGYWENQVDKP